MHYSLTEAHIEAIKTVLSQIGPCTLMHLVRHLKAQKICADLDNIAFVVQLRKLVEAGRIDRSKIVRSKVMSGLTNKQKLAIEKITTEAYQNGETLSFEELAGKVLEYTDETDNVDSIVKKIKMLFVPMYAGENDGEGYSS